MREIRNFLRSSTTWPAWCATDLDGLAVHHRRAEVLYARRFAFCDPRGGAKQAATFDFLAGGVITSCLGTATSYRCSAWPTSRIELHARRAERTFGVDGAPPNTRECSLFERNEERTPLPRSVVIKQPARADERQCPGSHEPTDSAHPAGVTRSSRRAKSPRNQPIELVGV